MKILIIICNFLPWCLTLFWRFIVREIRDLIIEYYNTAFAMNTCGNEIFVFNYILYDIFTPKVT